MHLVWTCEQYSLHKQVYAFTSAVSIELQASLQVDLVLVKVSLAPITRNALRG